MNRIKEINLHITEFCSGHCPMCYATDEDMVRKHGDIKTLKKIVHNAICYGGVDRFVMVGGDPCEHPNLVELLKYIKIEGKKYNINAKSMVISNTHDYRENNKPVNIEDIVEYIDGMCVTIHGETEKEHDMFNGSKGSYNHIINNLKKYNKIKSKLQEICIIVNLMPQTVKCLEEIMIKTNERLENGVNSFAIQRIAPIGRACGTVKYFIEQEDVNEVLKICKKMKEEKGFYLELVDVFPWCIVNPEYRYLLREGGCNWGTEYCAVFEDGSISRCAMSENKLSKNMLELDSKEKFDDFWKNDRELNMFREREHLDEKCINCSLLEKCGGGCVLARRTGDPYKFNIVKKGHDYLARRSI